MKTLVFLDFHQDNVVSDLADALPGNDKDVLLSPEIAETSRTRDNERRHAARPAVELHVDGAAEAFTGAGVDDLFLFQLAYTHGRPAFFQTLYEIRKIYACPFIDTPRKNTV